MAGLKTLIPALALAFTLQAAGAQPSLKCKKEIATIDTRSAPPSDVATDSKGRAYVLYEGDGFLDIYDDNGKMLQHRGGEAERESELTSITPLSLWVGRLGRSALLVSEPHQQVVRAVLVPDGDKLLTVPLRGAPEQMTGHACVARDLEGRIYVWLQNANRVYVFDGNGQYGTSIPTPGLKRPNQLCVDSQGRLFCLDSAGLTVFNTQGGVAFEVLGATAMYLTGSDRLALAGREWVRRYAPEGRLEIDLRNLDLVKDYEPIAISLNDDGQFFVYGRDPMSGKGLIQKLNSHGEVLLDFPQPQRQPMAPDPGIRLDFEGRLRLWENHKGQWQKLHPSGKLEKSWSFVPEADPRGRLSKPADVVIDSEDTAWIADAGNSRLQRFNLSKGGWLKPFILGIRGGDQRGEPRSLALGRGVIYCVVYPPRRQGDIVLQTRDRAGQLQGQRPICSSVGDPVVKVACASNGDIFLYQSRAKTRSGWEDNPTLTHFDAAFHKIAEVGADGVGLSPPGHPNQRLFLKPQEDLVPWGTGLLIATSGMVYRLNGELQVQAEYKLQLKRRNTQRLEDFGGASLHKQVLFLTDMGNQCVQRVVLP